MKAKTQYTLKLKNFTVEVTQKQMKTIRLRILPNGQVRLSAPLSLSRQEIEQFAVQHQNWVEAQMQDLAARKAASCGTDEQIILWGTPCPLFRRPAALPSVCFSAGRLLLACPENYTAEQREQLLAQWYRKELGNAIRSRLPYWENATGLHCAGFQIRAMKSRWGSCTVQTKKLRFALQLVHHPLPCLDYVILHELCHLSVPNHGPAFKALLDRYMPDWQARKKLLEKGDDGV